MGKNQVENVIFLGLLKSKGQLWRTAARLYKRKNARLKICLLYDGFFSFAVVRQRYVAIQISFSVWFGF
jgi:hypothetical protein